MLAKRLYSVPRGSTSTLIPVHPTSAFQQRVRADPVLRSLLAALHHPTPNALVNAPSTMPGRVPTRAVMFEEVAAAFPAKTGVSLWFKQWFLFGKMLVLFFKNGIMNVYRNQKLASAILKGLMATLVDAQGAVVPTKMSLKALDAELVSAIYLQTVEADVKARAASPPKSEEAPLQEGLVIPPLCVSRSEYQLLHRTRRDLPKLPIFGLAFVVFEESLPFVLYFFPSLSPSTCVLPMVYPRLMRASTSATAKLAALRSLTLKELPLEKLAHQTPYTLPLEELRLLVRSLNLVPRMLPLWAYPERFLRQRLEKYHAYITVDNRLIQANGGVAGLDTMELIKACVERNLIDLSAHKYADLVELQGDAAELQALRIKLAVFIVDLSRHHVGYFGLNHIRDEALGFNYTGLVEAERS